MVEKEKLRQKIQLIREEKSKIEKNKELTFEEFKENDFYEAAATRIIQVMVEAVLDICAHIIAREGWGTHKTYVETIQIATKNGLISREKEEDFKNMATFRNRVVHLYDQPNPEEICRILKDKTSDFDYFISQVVKEYFQPGFFVKK